MLFRMICATSLFFSTCQAAQAPSALFMQEDGHVFLPDAGDVRYEEIDAKSSQAGRSTEKERVMSEVRHRAMEVEAATTTASPQADFGLGDTVTVNGRQGIVAWDGRPEHAFVKVQWADDKSKSGVISVNDVKFVAKPCWGFTNANDTVECQDGAMVTDFMCAANGHGQRVKCPRNKPFMCARKNCGNCQDHCCTTDPLCGNPNAGGPRPCEAASAKATCATYACPAGYANQNSASTSLSQSKCCKAHVCSNVTGGRSSAYPCRCGTTDAATMFCTGNNPFCTASNDTDGVCRGNYRIGDRVELSTEGLCVAKDYDWSKDPLAPGNVGKVTKLDSLGDPLIRGPSGREGWYQSKHVTIAHEAATTTLAPQATGASQSFKEDNESNNHLLMQPTAGAVQSLQDYQEDKYMQLQPASEEATARPSDDAFGHFDEDYGHTNGFATTDR